MKRIFLALTLLFTGWCTNAQQLTDAQITILRAAVCADATAASYQTTNDTANVRAWLNADATPTFTIWRKTYTTMQLRAAILRGSTQLDGLTVGKRDSLLWVAQADIDMTSATIRTALDDLTGGQSILKASVIDGGKRAATRAEKALATGTGTGASPATSAIEGAISDQEAQRVVFTPSGNPAGC